MQIQKIALKALQRKKTLFCILRNHTTVSGILSGNPLVVNHPSVCHPSHSHWQPRQASDKPIVLLNIGTSDKNSCYKQIIWNNWGFRYPIFVCRLNCQSVRPSVRRRRSSRTCWFVIVLTYHRNTRALLFHSGKNTENDINSGAAAGGGGHKKIHWSTRAIMSLFRRDSDIVSWSYTSIYGLMAFIKRPHWFNDLLNISQSSWYKN